jgi:hypothetical protein
MIHPIVAQTQEEQKASVWTISSRIYDAMMTAESRFGPSDMTYSIVGYAFLDIQIPLLGQNPKKKELLLKLPKSVANDLRQAVYQLSHEVIHTLAPQGAVRPTVLEEGLATLFSEQYFERAYPGYSMRGTVKSYVDARDAVARYLPNDAFLRAARTEQPTFSEISPAILQRANPSCDLQLAEYLCSSFKR